MQTKKTKTYTEYATREEWIAGRKNGLGASEIAIVCGIANYKSPKELWQEKTGRKKPKDLSDNARVAYGTKAEEYLRELFKLKHIGDFEVEYHAFRVYHAKDNEHLTATLDGEITRIVDGAKGVYECKTQYIQSRAEREEWDGKVPQKYYCQALHQLYVTGRDFVIINAELRYPDNSAEIIERTIDRADVQDDIKYIGGEGAKFWQYVEDDKEPPVKLLL